MTSQDMRIRSSLPSTSFPQLGYEGRPVETYHSSIGWLAIKIDSSFGKNRPSFRQQCNGVNSPRPERWRQRESIHSVTSKKLELFYQQQSIQTVSTVTAVSGKTSEDRLLCLPWNMVFFSRFEEM